jgi:putative membrane protein
MIRFVVRALAAALGLALSARIVPGVEVVDMTNMVVAGAILGLLNAVVRPFLVLMTLPLSVISLGLFLFLVNGAMVYAVSLFDPGVHFAGLWPAVLASLVISFCGWLVTIVIGDLREPARNDRIRL